MPDSLAFYFDLVTRETLCEGARLEQVLVPARLRCDALRAGVGSEGRAVPLHGCGAAGEVVAGNELEVESIEVEEGAECIA